MAKIINKKQQCNNGENIRAWLLQLILMY